MSPAGPNRDRRRFQASFKCRLCGKAKEGQVIEIRPRAQCAQLGGERIWSVRPEKSSAQVKVPMDLLAYLEAITDLEPLLPVFEHDEFERYQRSAEFVSDSRWPGWEKYLGPRP